MSTKITLATLAVLLTAISIQGAAYAQNYAGPAAANSQRIKLKIPSSARAEATPRSRGSMTPSTNITGESAYRGHFTLPEFDPQYHGSNGG